MRPIDLSVTFVYVVDESLGMSKGKIAAQVSHVAMLLADRYKVLGRAIILKADHTTFNTFLQFKDVMFIQDAGLTEVPKGTITCLGFRQNEFMHSYTKYLKLV